MLYNHRHRSSQTLFIIVNTESLFTRRNVLRTLLAGSPLALTGCLTVQELDQVQADWDKKHPEGTGIMLSGAPKLFKVLATYKATAKQAQAARDKANKALVKMAKQRSRQVTPGGKPKNAPTTRRAVIVRADNPKVILAKTKSPSQTVKKAAQLAKELGTTVAVIPEKVAVKVPADSRLKGDLTAMVFDFSNHNAVGDVVYDVKGSVKPGTVAMWGSLEAEYLGP